MLDKTLHIAEKRRKVRLAPASSNSTTELVDSLEVPSSSEEFESLGYSKEVVMPSETNGFMKPFSVWCRESEEGCELEVVGCPALLAWGGDKAEAYEHLFEFIHSNEDLLAEDDIRGSSLLEAWRLHRASHRKRILEQ